jgi:hypothetical protein
MSLLLLDDNLRVTIYFDRSVPRLDSICLYLEESCSSGEKLLRDSEAGLYLTPGQARALAAELQAAVAERDAYCA